MILPDANLLIYAYDAGSPWHAKSAAWWTSTLNGNQRVGMAWVVALAFLRISTHTGINENPMSVAEFGAILESWEQTGLVEYLMPGRQHRSLMLRLLSECGTSGNLTNDAHLAALAVENGAVIYSHDTDFHKFPEIHWVNPLG